MEDERSFGSGFSGVAAPLSRRSPLIITAGISVVALVTALGWSFTAGLRSRDEALTTASSPTTTGANTASSSALALAPSADTYDVSQVGPAVVGALAADYESLQSSGSYSPQAGSAAGQELATEVSAPVPYTPFTAAQIKTTSDTSDARVKQYESDLRAAIAPILQAGSPEIQIYGEYVQTGDPQYLTQLEERAAAYEAAASSSAQVVVPQDAVTLHLGVVNATQQFGATLQAMAGNASDPVTSAVLLETYEQAEQQLISAFNALDQYFAQHQSS